MKMNKKKQIKRSLLVILFIYLLNLIFSFTSLSHFNKLSKNDINKSIITQLTDFSESNMDLSSAYYYDKFNIEFNSTGEYCYNEKTIKFSESVWMPFTNEKYSIAVSYPWWFTITPDRIRYLQIFHLPYSRISIIDMSEFVIIKDFKIFGHIDKITLFKNDIYFRYNKSKYGLIRNVL